MELKGKNLAELRSKEIKEMVVQLEQQRDALYDEIANRRGRVEVIEEMIKEIYDRIVQVNKEVKQQELAEEVRKRAEEEEKKTKEKKAEERDEFEKAKRGVKTPKPTRRKRTKKKKKD